MEAQTQDVIIIPGARVKATLKLGSEVYSVIASKGGNVSEQLVSVKEESMSILNEFITKHNVPNDVPDELVESDSEEEEEEEDETAEKRQVKSKKKRLS